MSVLVDGQSHGKLFSSHAFAQKNRIAFSVNCIINKNETMTAGAILIRNILDCRIKKTSISKLQVQNSEILTQDLYLTYYEIKR